QRPSAASRTSPPNTGGACSKAQPPPATPQVLSRGHEAVAPTVGHSDTAVAGRFGVSPGQPAFIAGCRSAGPAPRRISFNIAYRISHCQQTKFVHTSDNEQFLSTAQNYVSVNTNGP